MIKYFTRLQQRALEAVIVLYILSGIIKNSLVLFGIEVSFDVTVILGILIIIQCSYGIIKNLHSLQISQNNLVLLFMLLTFIVWILISMLISDSQYYKYTKLLGIFTGLLFLVIPLSSNNISLKRVFGLFIAALLIGSWSYLYVMANYKDFSNFYDIHGMYLYFGKLLGTGTIVLFFGWKRVFKLPFSFALFFIAICLTTLLALGARGPLIFVLITVIATAIWRFLRNRLHLVKIGFSRMEIIRSVGLILLLFLGFFGLLSSNDAVDTIQRSFSRFALLFEFLDAFDNGSGGKSIVNRLEFIGFSMDGIFSNVYHFFIGHGFGSFGLNYIGTESEMYPHNLFLEAWYELGLVGLILLLALLIALIKQSAASFYAYLFLPLIFFELLNFSKSGSFGDVRILCFLFIMAVSNAHQQLRLKVQTQHEG